MKLVENKGVSKIINFIDKNIIKNKSLLKTIIFIIVAAALYIGIYYAMSKGIIKRSGQSIILRMCFNVVLAVSLNLIVGYLGDLSLGHAAFYAVGAYTGCFTVLQLEGLPLELRFLIGILVGGISAGVVGALISSAILRLKGDYLAIVTLAFGELIRSMVKIVPGFGGTKGLQGIPSFETKPKSFLFFFAVTLITVIVITNIAKSRHGRIIKAIRDNVIAANSVGINIKKYKIIAFTVAAFFAGIAGVMLGFNTTSIEPNNFKFNLSIEILVMVVLGGMTIYGSAIAACILTTLPEILRGADQYRLLIYAIALIVMMLFSSNPKMIELKKKFNIKGFVLKLRDKRFTPKAKEEKA